MGYYIDPKDMSKEEWLIRNGQRVSQSDAKQHSIGDKVLVCLVDNGVFTAAGIAYCDRDRDAFLHPDPRPKHWYLVKRELLKQFCPLL